MFGYSIAARIIEDVLSAACAQKAAWDGFTKPQRKSISQWKEYANVSYNQCYK